MTTSRFIFTLPPLEVALASVLSLDPPPSCSFAASLVASLTDESPAVPGCVAPVQHPGASAGRPRPMMRSMSPHPPSEFE
jgi:hypothetical protein